MLAPAGEQRKEHINRSSENQINLKIYIHRSSVFIYIFTSVKGMRLRD